MTNEVIPADISELADGLYNASCRIEGCDWQFTTSSADILSAVRVHMRKHEQSAGSPVDDSPQSSTLKSIGETRGAGESAVTTRARGPEVISESGVNPTDLPLTATAASTRDLTRAAVRPTRAPTFGSISEIAQAASYPTNEHARRLN